MNPILTGLLLAIVVGIPAGYSLVIFIRDVRRWKRIDQSPQWPVTETLKPGQKPILNTPCIRQGSLITVTAFGPLNSPFSKSDDKSLDAPDVLCCTKCHCAWTGGK